MIPAKLSLLLKEPLDNAMHNIAAIKLMELKMEHFSREAEQERNSENTVLSGRK